MCYRRAGCQFCQNGEHCFLGLVCKYVLPSVNPKWGFVLNIKGKENTLNVLNLWKIWRISFDGNLCSEHEINLYWAAFWCTEQCQLLITSTHRYCSTLCFVETDFGSRQYYVQHKIDQIFGTSCFHNWVLKGEILMENETSQGNPAGYS